MGIVLGPLSVVLGLYLRHIYSHSPFHPHSPHTLMQTHNTPPHCIYIQLFVYACPLQVVLYPEVRDHLRNYLLTVIGQERRGEVIDRSFDAH